MPDEQTQDMRRRAKEVERIAVEARAEAVSEDGSVRVVVGAGGNIGEIDLQFSAFQMSGVELGEAIVETIRAAESRVQTELAAEISRIMGTDVPADAFGGRPGGDEQSGEQRR